MGMKIYISMFILILVLFVAESMIYAEDAPGYNPPFIDTNFIIEIYENGKSTGREFYVDLKVMNKDKVEWTTIFFNNIRNIKDEEEWGIPIVSRWDTAIYDVVYDNDSFRIKLKFAFATEELIVRGSRAPNSLSRFNVEGVGFRKDLSGNNVKIEWKSIANFD